MGGETQLLTERAGLRAESEKKVATNLVHHACREPWSSESWVSPLHANRGSGSPLHALHERESRRVRCTEDASETSSEKRSKRAVAWGHCRGKWGYGGHVARNMENGARWLNHQCDLSDLCAKGISF